MIEKILITGATGIIGRSLVKSLLVAHPGIEIHILTRSQNQDESENIKIHTANLENETLGISEHQYIEFTNSITHIIHLAAATRFNLPIEEIRKINVKSTVSIMKLAAKCKNIKRVIHVSTAFVAGKRIGVIYEDELTHSSGFLNTYEQSKYEAEEALEQYRDKIPLIVARPSLVIDKAKKLDKSPMNAVFLAIFLAKKGFLPILPGDGEYKLDMIGVEDVTHYMSQLLFKKDLNHFRYHITNPGGAIQINELLKLTIGEKQIQYCGDMEQFEAELKRRVRFRPDLKYYYTKTERFLGEVAYLKTFNNHHLISEFPSLREWIDTRGILKTI